MTFFPALAASSLRQKTVHARGVIGANAAVRLWRCNNSKRWISSSRLTIERQTDTTSFDSRPPKEKLVFGQTPSDHMLMIEFEKDSQQWGIPRIVPYQDLVLSPAASCLHYGLQCFEGMKAYKLLGTKSDTKNNNKSNDDDDSDSTVCLFRPDMNMKRLQKSMERLQMPGSDFDHNELIQCIAKLVELDKKWIPYGEGYSLYIRPTVIATQRFLGLAAADSLLLYVITTPVGPYYKSGFKPVRLTADTPHVRAWPGGTGDCKVGGNYAPTMKAQVEAMKGGYSQVLWLFHDTDTGEDTVTEVGAMNVFFVIANKDTGRPELVTPPLTRGDILHGVTRDSILYLARHKWEKYMDVSERFPTMSELVQAAADGRLLEAFGAGTAAVVTPISAIQYRGKDIDIPATGPATQRIWDEVTGIQYGKIPGPDGWCVPIS